MARKIHGIVKDPGNFNAIISKSKQDGMAACQTDSALRVKLRPQTPAARIFSNAFKGGPDHGEIAVCLIGVPGADGVVINRLKIFDGCLCQMELHALCLRLRK